MCVWSSEANLSGVCHFYVSLSWGLRDLNIIYFFIHFPFLILPAVGASDSLHQNLVEIHFLICIK